MEATFKNSSDRIKTGGFAVDTLVYSEYANKGPGADTTGRVGRKGYLVIITELDYMIIGYLLQHWLV